MKDLFLTRDDPQLKPIVARYRHLLQEAGKEIVQNLKINEQTQKALEEELIPHDLYLQNHNEIFNQFILK